MKRAEGSRERGPFQIRAAESGAKTSFQEKCVGGAYVNKGDYRFFAARLRVLKRAAGIT